MNIKSITPEEEAEAAANRNYPTDEKKVKSETATATEEKKPEGNQPTENEEATATTTTTRKPLNPETMKIWNELATEATTNSNELFKSLIRSDEATLNGEKVHFRMLNHRDTRKLTLLQKEGVNEEEDWDKYIENYRHRAILLIQEMTPEKFDKIDFFELENLITAWSIRATKGFRHLLKVS